MSNYATTDYSDESWRSNSAAARAARRVAQRGGSSLAAGGRRVPTSPVGHEIVPQETTRSQTAKASEIRDRQQTMESFREHAAKAMLCESVNEEED